MIDHIALIDFIMNEASEEQRYSLIAEYLNKHSTSELAALANAIGYQ